MRISELCFLRKSLSDGLFRMVVLIEIYGALANDALRVRRWETKTHFVNGLAFTRALYLFVMTLFEKKKTLSTAMILLARKLWCHVVASRKIPA